MKHLRFTLKTVAISVMTLGYIFVLGHFLYSNFNHTIGGNFTWSPAEDYYPYSYPECTDPCIQSGLNYGYGEFSEDTIRRVKGFPVESSDTFYYYGSRVPTDNINVAGVIINLSYILLLSGGYFVAMRKLLRKRNHTAPKH